MPQFIAVIFQVTALRLGVDGVAHGSRSWVTGQAQGVSAYLSPGSSRAPRLRCRLLQSGVHTRLLRATREARQRLPAQPSVAEGQGAGVGLARSVWLEDQPVEESRSRRAWAQGHLGRECGPRLCERWAHKTRPGQASRWSWARKAAWGQGQ